MHGMNLNLFFLCMFEDTFLFGMAHISTIKKDLPENLPIH